MGNLDVWTVKGNMCKVGKAKHMHISIQNTKFLPSKHHNNSIAIKA